VENEQWHHLESDKSPHVKTDTAVKAYSSGTARDSHPIPSYTPLSLFETSRDHYDGNKDIVFYNNSKPTIRYFHPYIWNNIFNVSSI